MPPKSKAEMLLAARAAKKVPVKQVEEDKIQKRKQQIADMLKPLYDNGELTRDYVSFEHKGEQYIRSIVQGEDPVVFKVQPDYSLDMVGMWDAEGKKIKFQ
jgi:hypothetical protein